MNKPLHDLGADTGLTEPEDPIALAIERLAGKFVDHPGFMWTRSGFEVLHAKWPAYPIGHGRRAALYTLAEYPPDTRFFRVDNIDRCTLMSVGRRLAPASAGPEHLFVAVWDDDLRDLSRAGLIEGLSHLDADFLYFPQEYVELTPRAAHLALIYELTAGLHPRILDRVDELLEIDRCDAAVREASVVLEEALGALVTRPKSHGKRLIDQVFQQVGNQLPLPNAKRIQLKAEFLRFFAYVRNEFAHKI